MTHEFSCKYCARVKWLVNGLDGICPVEGLVEANDCCEDFKPKLLVELRWWLEDLKEEIFT